MTAIVLNSSDVNSGILARLQSSDAQNSVDLSKMNLYASDMEALLKSLQCSPDVVRLDLSNNLIDDQGVTNVCQAVASLSQLKALNLSGNLLTADGVMKMDNLFSGTRMHLTELSELNLSFNRVTDTGVQYASRLCSNLPKLQKLSLKSCHLTRMDSLNLTWNQLTSLDVSHNNFGSLRSLWTNLRVDRIRELNFDLAISSSYSNFPSELIQYLKASHSNQLPLESLFLSNCNFSDTNLWELLQVLKKAQLKHLSLMNNPNLSSLSLMSLLKGNFALDTLNLRACNQMAVDLKVSELSDCIPDITNLPKRMILSISRVADKTAITSALKDLWVSHFGAKNVKSENIANHTLIISISTE